MLPSRHIIVSLSLGAVVGSVTQSTFAAFLCFTSGVLIDIDHLFEYISNYGLRLFSFRHFYHACRKMANREEDGGVKKIYLVFHAIEIAILLWIGFALTQNIYLLAIALGYTGHLVLDMAANVMKPWGYFIIWRMKEKFTTIRLLRQC